MTPDLKHLLELAAEPVAEPDLVNTAWSGAQLQRRRSRSIAVGTAAAAAAAVLSRSPNFRSAGPAMVPFRRRARRCPRPCGTVASSRCSESGDRSGHTPRRSRICPRPSEPAREHVALPERLGFDFGDELPVVSPEAAEYTREVFEAPCACGVAAHERGRGRPSRALPPHVAPALHRGSRPATAAGPRRGGKPDRTDVGLGHRRRSSPGRVLPARQGAGARCLHWAGEVAAGPGHYLNRAGWSDDNSTIIAGSDASNGRSFPRRAWFA